MEEEVHRSVKRQLVKKRAIDFFGVAAAVLGVLAALWFTATLMFWDSGWEVAPEEATPAYVQREYAALILPGHTEFQMKFFDPAANLTSFEYRASGRSEPLELLAERAATRGWSVRRVSERELRLERKIEGETSKRIARIQLAARSPRLVVLTSSADLKQLADERWTVIRSYLVQKRVNTR